MKKKIRLEQIRKNNKRVGDWNKERGSGEGRVVAKKIINKWGDVYYNP